MKMCCRLSSIILVLGIFIFLSSTAFCASIGDVETNGKGKFAVGVDEEFIFYRGMQGKAFTLGETVNTVAYSGTVYLQPKIEWMDRLLIKASYGMLDFMDVFIKFGESSSKTKVVVNGPMTWAGGGPTWANAVAKYKCGPTPVYAGGIRVAVPVPEFKDLLIGCDVQYMAQYGGYDGEVVGEYHGGGQDGSFVRKWNNRMLIQEWHAAPYIAVKIEKLVPYTSFIPYVGIKYSDFCEFSADYFGGKENYYADTNIGLFTGINVKICDNITLNCEGRFFDETALSFGGAVKF